MSAGFIVTGTDTGIGKTVFCAALAGALGAIYWKPIQSGLDGETDSDTVMRLSGLPSNRILPEAYRLTLPASPHIAAAREGIAIEAHRLSVPKLADPVVIEGAGGLLVPLSQDLLQIEMFASWKLPVILCARTAIGTINHTLLSIEAMAARNILVHGVAFIGDEAKEVENTIVAVGKARRLGRLPFLEPLSAGSLADAFRKAFHLDNFTARVAV
jgi:dethiobiotin synthetase